jgi:TonB family protein
MASPKSKKSKNAGMVGTLAVHGVLLLLLILWKLIAPTPPPESEGILINFGTSDQGTGEIQPTETTSNNNNEEANDEKFSEPEQSTPEPTNRKSVLTQDTEKAPVLPKEKPKPVVKPKDKPKPVKENPKPVKPTPDPKALYPGKKNDGKGNSGSEGTTGKPGDQGALTGDPNAASHTGSGKGNSGVSFDLAGRSILHRPKIDDKSQETGKVVVDITVDKNGNVKSVNAPARGSTTSAPNLVSKAKFAAKQARFSKSPTGVEQQHGTITFIFKFE